MLTRNSAHPPQLDDSPEQNAFARVRAVDSVESSAVTNAFDLRTFWLTLCWRARLIAGITLATVVLATAALIVIPPKYQATAVVIVDPRQLHVTDTPTVLTGIGADAAAVESQVEIITSTALARKVITAMKLEDDPEFSQASWSDEISSALHTLVGGDGGALLRTKEERLISNLQKNLTVRRRGQTYVLEINFYAKDAAKAARIANAVAQAYLADQREVSSNTTASASEWLDSRMEGMRERLRRSDEAVESYRSSHNIVDVTQGNKLINRQIEDLTQQIALARTYTADARARMEQVESAARHKDDPSTLSEVLQSPVITNLRSQYTDAARTVSEYSTMYGERYPALSVVRARLADVRRQIDDEIARILAGVRNDYQTAVNRQNTLEGALAGLKEQFAAADEAEIKLHELERDAQANRDLFEQFLNRAKQTSEQQSMQIADARIVAPALPPLKPSRPAMSLLLGAAACAGLLLAIAIALLMEQMRQGFRSLREATQFLALPALGMLPTQPDDTEEARNWRNWRRSPSKGDVSGKACRFALRYPRSAYARQLRAIQARLFDDMTTTKIVTVASAVPGEGKSTFACNFALAAADIGMRTLLIDGDIYTGKTGLVFGSRKAGLSEVLNEQISLRQALAKDPVTGLCVLGARDPSRAAQPETIDPARLESLLHQCRNEFDLVVLDTPAILPVGGIAPYLKGADCAVLVVEWDGTPRQAVSEALDLLDMDAQKIAGLVLNKVSPRWFRLFRYGGRYPESASVLQTAA
jgi:succinoglycan biosynthesis transport protein ExoP